MKPFWSERRDVGSESLCEIRHFKACILSPEEFCLGFHAFQVLIMRSESERYEAKSMASGFAARRPLLGCHVRGVRLYSMALVIVKPYSF